MKLKFSNKSWIVLSTTIIIGVAFSIYFLVYVKGKEREMIANNFRVLQQVVQNIGSLENSFQKNAEIRSITMRENAETNQKLIKINKEQSKEAELLSTNGENKTLYGKTGIYFRVNDIKNSYDIPKFGNYYFTDYDVFFNNELFLRNDIFKQIIIFKTNIDGSGVTSRDVLFSNEPVGILDSIFYQESIRSAKDEITINDERYISFNQKIHVDSNIFISGLVLKSSFEQQKRSVSPFIIFILSTALILIILAMPLLKLKIMSPEERLHSKDVVFIVVSVLIGPAIFLVFSYTSIISFGVQEKLLRNDLDSLSHRIEFNLNKELSQVVFQMDLLNDHFEYIKDKSDIKNDSIFSLDALSEDILFSKFGENVIETTTANKIKGYRVYRDIINSDLIPFKHLKLFFWITKEAQALIFLSSFDNPGYAQNLSHRKYITNITDDQPNTFINSAGQVHEIAIESIKSVNDGSYEVGIGKSTKGSILPVMAVSMKMASTMGTILEEGYGFCILDKNGNTMFHSEITKNMNENFINETHQVFLPAIESHTGMFQSVNYNGMDQTIYFRPLDCLSGLYIATFVNTEVQDAPFTLAMISAFIMFLGYLFLVMVVSPLLYFSNFKLTKLRQNIKVFNFVRPYETDNFFKKYIRLTIISFAIIVYLIMSILINAHHNSFIISEMIQVILVLLICSLYSLSIGLHAHYNIHSGIRKPSKAGYSIAVYLLIALSVLRLILIVWNSADGFLIINALAGTGFIVCIILAVFYEKNIFNIKSFEKSPRNSAQIQRAYLYMIMLWVIIYSFIPINLFLHIAIEKEDEIFAKYRSLNLINKIESWEKTNRKEFRDKFADSEEGEQNYKTFIKSMSIDSINFALSEEHVKWSTEIDNGYYNSVFDNLYEFIRPNYNDRSAISRSYISNTSSDSKWFFRTSNHRNVFTSHFPINQPELAAVTVETPKIDFFRDNWLLIVMITIGSMFILYSFMNFILIKIYGFNYKKYAEKVGSINAKTFVEYFLKKAYFSNNSSYNNIFIVGANSAHLSFIKDYFNKSHKETFVTLDFYDFSQAPDEGAKSTSSKLEELKLERFNRDWGKIKKLLDTPDQKAYVLVEHFEFGYNDLQMNKLKLEVLKYLVDCENFKLMVKSEINVTKVLDCYEDSIKRHMHILKKASTDKQIELQNIISDLKIDYKKWQHLLGSFTTCIIPINIIDKKNEEERINNPAISGRFETGEELIHGEFLDMLNNYISGKPVIDLPDEDKILTIHQMSYPYYFSLWNSLSKDERYLVFDIAKDRYVNTVNSNAILSLLNKGILVYDHSLRLMNESFAEFVLTKVNYEEALEMELESRKKGSWNTALAVILLLIISLVIFLSIGQQSFLNDLNAFLTAIAALIGLLIRFSGFLSFGGSKSVAE